MRSRKPHSSIPAEKRLIPRLKVSRLSWGVAIVVTILALPSTGQEPGSQIQAEAERLQQSLKDKPLSLSDFPNASTEIGNGLNEVIQGQAAGRLYVSIEKLGQMTDFLYGVRAAADKAERVKSGLPAYEAEWEQASLRIANFDRQASEKDWGSCGVAIRALSETAQNLTVPLMEGARGFAISTKPSDGLFNLGEAEGQAQFAVFCSTLNIPRKGTAYPLRSLLPEIETLQEKTTAAFKPPRSIDLHTLFMSLNAAIKQARELDATKHYAGALFQYLYAVGYYGMLDTPALDPPQQSVVKSALTAARQKLYGSQRDESIAQFFLEKAESQIAHVDGSAPRTDDWRIAKVVVDQVLPAYFAVDKPLPVQERASSKTVDLTLVRWPYT